MNQLKNMRDENKRKDKAMIIGIVVAVVIVAAIVVGVYFAMKTDGKGGSDRGKSNE